MSEITDAVFRNQFTHVPQESHQYPEIPLFSDVFRESREGVARPLAISGDSRLYSIDYPRIGFEVLISGLLREI